MVEGRVTESDRDMKNQRKEGKYRQLTLEQALVGGSSSRKSDSLVESGESGSQQPQKAADKRTTGATAHASSQHAAGRRGRGRAEARRSEKESSSEDYSEPDPDSASDWLPSRSESSRESSPDACIRASSRTAGRQASTSSSVPASVTSASTVGEKKRKVTKSKEGSWSRTDWKAKFMQQVIQSWTAKLHVEEEDEVEEEEEEEEEEGWWRWRMRWK
uniref:Uncharacterized protein n=1 Tax=Knipowitschia caucasica TaxID=637954 RepID=A0AAV2J6S5_KNICA